MCGFSEGGMVCLLSSLRCLVLKGHESGNFGLKQIFGIGDL